MGRRHDLDLIRGIGMLLVMIGHIFATYRNEGSFESHILISSSVCSLIYSVHMPLMFFISGYTKTLVNHKRRTVLRDNLKKYIINLFVPYLFFSYLMLIMDIMFHVIKFDTIEFLTVFVVPISGLWFLLTLLIIKVIQNLFELKISNTKYYIVFWTFIFAGAVIFEKYIPNIIYYVCLYGLSYYMGIKIYNMSLDKKKLLYAVLILCIGECVYYRMNSSLGKTLAGVSLATILLYFGQKYNWKNKAIEYIGKNCIVFYIIDGFTNSPVRIILAHLNITNYWSVSIMTLMIKIAVPTIILLIGNNVKLLKFILNFFYPRRWLATNIIEQ